jgi:hypothetical protein
LCKPHCTQLIVFPPRPSQHFNIFPPNNLANIPNHYLKRRQQGEHWGVSRREVSDKFLYFFIPLIFNCFSLSPLLTPFYIFLSSKQIHSTQRFWRRLDWGVAEREGRGSHQNLRGTGGVTEDTTTNHQWADRFVTSAAGNNKGEEQ